MLELGTIPSSVNVARGVLEFWASPASPYYRQYFEEDFRIALFCAPGGRSACAVKDLKAMVLKTHGNYNSSFRGGGSQVAR